MQRIIASALLALLVSCGMAQAQSTSVVLLPGGCGTASYPNGISYLTVDSTGHLCTSGSGGGGGGTSSAFGAAFPATGTAVGFSDGTNMVAGRVKPASTAPLATDPALVVAISPNVGGITPVVSSALESNHVIKASAGVFISGYITTGAVQGWLLISNTATAPTAGGAAIAPLACVYAPANATTSIGGAGGPSIIASTGITMVFSSSGCLTNTASVTAFFSGQAL